MSLVAPDIRTWAEIDMEALLHNFNLARATGKKVCCVIKANAYGHGAIRCGLFLQRHGADWFAVACMAEALELRGAGVTRPILILGYTPPEDARMLAKYNVTCAASDEAHAIEMNEAARHAGVTIQMHVKVDTGMSRTGLMAQGRENAVAAAEAVERMMGLSNIRITGMFTHFSVADTPGEDEYTAWQLENYKTVLDILTKKGLRPQVCHTSNSACILDHPETMVDMVREGIILYGMYPDSEPRRDGPLKPVMTLKSRVVQVRELPAGTTVSYGRTYRADAPFTSAVVCAGYADGHPRRLSNQGYDMIKGKPYKQVGRICMDMHMLDVTGSDVKRGDEVTLWGGSGMSTEEAAQIVGTINYELTCLVTPRSPRVYLKEDI